MKKHLLFLSFLTFLGCGGPMEEAAESSPRVSLLSGTGELLPYSDRGDRLPDFSQVGYRAGDADYYPHWRELPEIRVYAEGEGDASRIQAAIDQAASLPLNEDGYRALVLLAGAEFRLEETVHLHSSGIVLAGLIEEGRLPRLVLEPIEGATAVWVQGDGLPEMDLTRATTLTVDYLPSGTSVLPVADASAFQPGDRIIVEHAFNARWVSALGMDRIPPRWRTDADGTRRDGTVQWDPATFVYPYRRIVEVVEENQLILDIPLPKPLIAEFGETTIAPYTYPGQIRNVGVRDLEIVSVFDRSVRSTLPRDESSFYFSDENHGAWGIQVSRAKQGWIHNITVRHFVRGAVHLTRHAARFTVSGCRSLEPVGRLTGGRRYSFYISGQLHLVKDCYSEEGRHDFVLNSRVAGPNVFLNSRAVNAFSSSEPHHRMAFGLLFDNIEVTGPIASIGVFNRGNSGTGHGWAGAQVVLWNTSSPVLIAQSPPLYENFLFGVGRPIDMTTEANREIIDSRLIFINRQSGRNFAFDGETPVLGDGHIESRHGPVTPPSLYAFQRARHPRTGQSE